jgi:hypothetical protein
MGSLPLVINGLHRSGTTMTERLFDSQPNVVCFNLFFQIIRAVAITRGFSDKGEIATEDFGSAPNVIDEQNEYSVRSHFLTDYIHHVYWPYLLKSSGVGRDDPLFGIERETLLGFTEIISEHEDISDIASLLMKIGDQLGVPVCATRWTLHHRYAPVFLKHPEARWLEIVRNPYARISSERVSHHGNFAVVIAQQQDNLDFVANFKHDRYKVLKYENLCNDTDRALADVSEWLGAEIKNRDLIGIDGRPFRPNTSDNRRQGRGIYDGDENMPARIGSLDLDRWRAHLSDSDIAVLNNLLDFHGLYETETISGLSRFKGDQRAVYIRIGAGLKNSVKNMIRRLGITIHRA